MSTNAKLLSGVEIYLRLDFADKTVTTATRRGKTKVLRFLQGKLKSKGNVELVEGYCKVWYSKDKDLFNHFDFDSVEDLRSHLTIDCCLDPYLIKAFS